jgi:hypothetical protein
MQFRHKNAIDFSHVYALKRLQIINADSLPLSDSQ